MEKILTAIRNFVTDTSAELRKCTWPNRKELVESSILVIVTIFMVTALIFGIDKFYLYIFNSIT